MQKCLKYENGKAVDFQSFYRDNQTKTGILCFGCKQKQRKDLESELERLQQDQEADKEEMERLKKLIESSDSSNKNNEPINREREREREREQSHSATTTTY